MRFCLLIVLAMLMIRVVPVTAQSIPDHRDPYPFVTAQRIGSDVLIVLWTNRTGDHIIYRETACSQPVKVGIINVQPASFSNYITMTDRISTTLVRYSVSVDNQRGIVSDVPRCNHLPVIVR